MSTSYLDRQVLPYTPNFKGVASGTLDDFIYESRGLGAATPWKATDRPRRRVRYSFLLEDTDAAEFRSLFSDHDGQRIGMWVPCFVNDYALTADASATDTEIVVQKTRLDDAVSTFGQFSHLALLTRDGKREFYEIDSVAVVGQTEEITLASGLETDLVADDTICAGLIFARLAEDEIELRYLSPSIVEVTVTFLELPTEYTTEHTGSRPVYLYKLTRGATTWRFANYGVDVTAGSQTWTAADITHSAIEAGTDFISEAITLTVGTDDSAHPLRYYLDRNAIERTDVEIYETDAAAWALDTSAPVYKGRVGRVTYGQNGEISAELSSIFRVTEIEAPRMNIQRPCVHRLFDAGCGLSAASFTTAGSIDAISSDPAYVEASEFGDKATAESDPDWFALGKVTVGTQVRFCVGANGNRLYLNAPFKGVSTGAAISAQAGCNKRVGTCDAKFGNLDNHLGFPYLPNKNPQFEALETPKPGGGKKS